MEGLSIKVLGDVEVHVDGQPIDVDTRKAVALLIYLVVTQTSASRDQLCTLLWAELDSDRARGALRRTLSVLRKALDGRWLTTDSDRVRLNQDSEVYVDTWHVDRLLSSLSAHDHDPGVVCPSCRGPLHEAAGLHRGEFLSGFSVRDSADFDEWQLAEAEAARRRRGLVLESLAEAMALRGEYSRAAEFSRQRVELSPLDEAAHRQAMLMSVWAGDRAGALRQYRECVRVLDEELGVPPLPETSDLEERILCDDIPEAPSPDSLVITNGANSPVTPSSTPSMVGRDSERFLLENLVEGSGGRVGVITGAPGVGKTRLAEEMVKSATNMGCRVVRARAYEGEATLGHVVVGEALRSAFEAWEEPPELDEQLAREASRLVSSIRPGSAGKLPPLSRDPGGQSRFADAICTVMTTLVGPDGVLVLDDLQWADAASLDLIGYLLRRRDRFPICSILIWRTSPLGDRHPLRRVVDDLNAHGRTVTIELSPLSDGDVRKIASEMAPGLDAGATEAVVGVSDGIPLVALHCVRLLDPESPEFDLDTLAEGDVAEIRMRGLSELARQVLSAASIIGRDFDPQEVQAASGRSDDETTQALEELIAADLVSETESDRLDITHDLVRHYARDSVSAVRARLLHGRLADHLIRHKQSGPVLGRIAHHLEIAGRSKEAGEFRARAGDHARSVFAHQEAIAHYEAALALGHTDLVRIHTAIGDLYMLSGDYAGALDSYRIAAARADGEQLAQVEHRMGEINGRLGRWDIAEHHFESARESMSGAPELVGLYTDWARMAMRRGDEERARELVGSAVGEEESTQETWPMITIMQGLFSSDPHKGEDHVQRGLRLAKEKSDSGTEAAALTALAILARRAGRPEAAMDRANSALAIVERLGDRHRQAALHDLLADLLHESGDEERAAEQVRRAVELFAEVGTGELEPEIWMTSPW